MPHHFINRCLAVALIMTPLVAQHALAADAAGPTPYPDPKDTAAWPGKGPVRVFKWMTDNRKAFWAKREKDQGAVVFVGDSLTANWKPDAAKQSFGDLKTANRGVGGDVSRGVLFRFKEDVLDLKPKAIVLCIGTNDLSAHANVADIVSNIEGVLDQARAQDAEMPVVVCTVPPRDSEKAPTKPGAHADLNERIKKLGEGRPNVTVFDLFAVLADADGKPKAEYVVDDKLHLASPAYAAWGEALKPLFAKLNIQ